MIESMKDLKKLNDKELIDCLFDFYTNDYEDKTNFDSSSVIRCLSLSASDYYVSKLSEYLNGKVFNENVGNYQDSIHSELCLISYHYFTRHVFNDKSSLDLDISRLDEKTYNNIFSLYNKLENVLMSRKEFYSNFNEEFKNFIRLILEFRRIKHKKNDYGIDRLYNFIQANDCFNKNFKYYKSNFIENSDLLNYKNGFKILVDNANHILFPNKLLFPNKNDSKNDFNGVVSLIDYNEKPDGLKLLMYEDFNQRSFKVFKKILMDEEKYNYLKSKIDVKDIEKFDYFFVSSYLDNIIKNNNNGSSDINLNDILNSDFFNYIFENKQKEVLNYFEKNIGNVFHGNGKFYTYKLLNSYILNKFVLFIAENDKKSTNEKENIFDSFINVFSTYQGLTDFKIYKNKSIGQIASEKKGVLSKILKNNMFSSREDVLNEVNYFEYFVQNYGFELLKKETFFDFSKIQENSIKVKETDYFDNNEYLVDIYKNVISDIFESNNMFKIEDDKITYLIQEFQFSYLFNIFKNKEFLEKNNLLNGLMKELNSIKEIDINNLVSFAKNNLINNNLLNKKNLKLLDNYSNMIEDFNLFFYPNLKNKSSKKIKL